MTREHLPNAARRAPHSPGRKFAGVIAFGLFLAACSGADAPPPPCPGVQPVKDAQNLVRFQGAGRDLTDVIFEANIEVLGLACDYDDNVVESDLRVRVVAVEGPLNKARQARFSYFIAIATLDERIVAREEFDLDVSFEGNLRRVAAMEQLTPRIPLKPGQSALDYRIYVGLVLTPTELQYNRDNR